MAVTNRGSILISTANDIGSSLVDVIGGEGYTPNEWSKKINLCGIAAADVPTALENIEESTPSGTDRGSISLDTANAVGAVLNKKFNTARGFKPSEWASAISKLTELEVKTASGSVASFDDGADDVPLKSCTCEIVPQQDLHGYANPWAPGAGKNLFNKDNPNLVEGYIDTTSFNTGNTNAKTIYIPIKSGETYTVSKTAGQRFSIATSDSIPSSGATYTSIKTQINASSLSITAGANDAYLWAWIFLEGTDTGTLADMLNSIQIELGSSATSWTPYSNICPITGTTEIEVTHTDGQTPPIESETKTAALGRTVYGGSFSSDGTLTEKYISVDLGSFTWIKVTNNVQAPYFSTTSALNPLYAYQNSNPNVKCSNYSYGSIGSSGTANGFYVIVSSYVRIRDNVAENMTADQFKTYITGVQLVYELETANEYDLDPLPEINSYYGDNNIFSDVQGGTTTVEYRADIDLALN